ncbi:hypothetical protein H5J25_13605 [Sphingomonas aliaeris]|uniref:Uncharacterized protein n=1 Tax=Sphingomonas aliaeris TaxID=2759526 RepID=A0A974NT82_9SPHN|nr:hypothetical protein [Sphingomonas aliaeris]QQV76486.1 hypothetical protein H5J25_13605 [Sphingomonas aliaeris]
MSQDRKPGKVRVLKAGDETPQRRRHDSDPIVVDGGGAGTRGAPWMMALLFLLAAIGCAAATELYLP